MGRLYTVPMPKDLLSMRAFAGLPRLSIKNLRLFKQNPDPRELT
ncbi:MAG: hypothetical protein ACM3XO_12860 [Bacteroidota bacterium]